MIVEGINRHEEVERERQGQRQTFKEADVNFSVWEQFFWKTLNVSLIMFMSLVVNRNALGYSKTSNTHTVCKFIWKSM